MLSSIIRGEKNVENVDLEIDLFMGNNENN